MDSQDRADEAAGAAQARLDLLAALTAAAARRDEVFGAIAQADDVDAAVTALRQLLGVGEVAAHAIVDAQLRLFTADGRQRLLAARDELRAQLGDR